MKAYICFESRLLGPISVGGENGFITDVLFGERQEGKPFPELITAVEQLQQYLAGERKEFDLSLKPIGTDFQKIVWDQLMEIPYGETRSYGEVSVSVGCNGGARAVGGANHKNPIPIIIPCHRVTNANGSLGGYGGGTDIKQKLLRLENPRYRYGIED